MMKPDQKIPSEVRDLMAAASDSDALIGDSLAGTIPPPSRPFHPKVAQSLADAVSAMSGPLGAELETMQFDGPVEALPPDLVRLVAMVAEAAADYGQPLPVELGDLTDDNKLMLVTAAIQALVDDEEFTAFLAEDIDTEEDDAEAIEPVEPVNPAEQLEFDFASRLRK
jgi:hypothetical protein